MPTKFHILLLVPVLILLLFLNFNQNTKTLAKLKSGEHTLICNITGEYQIVEPSKIVNIVDSAYIFTNGYSKTCKILKVPLSK